MGISYDNLIELLESRFEKVADNEFIVKQDRETGQKYILSAIKSSSLKDSKQLVKKLKEQILDDQGESDKPIKQFGIIIDSENINFLKMNSESLKLTVNVLRKKLDKISPAFQKKFNTLTKDLGDFSRWSELFNRSDIIDEFYKLFNKAKDNLLNKITGISDDVRKEIIADNFLMQLLIIWYLQENGFLNGDKKFLIKHFKDYDQLGFNNYYEFIKKLFEIMMGDSIQNIYNDTSDFGKIVITGPAPFLNGKIEEIQIPDKVFYVEGETDFLRKTEPKNVSIVPILNLFESRDWTEGNIDEFVLGAIYEKMISRLERKKLGAFYTPDEITSYICKNTIEPFLLNKVNDQFNSKFDNLNQVFNKSNQSILYFLFEELKKIKILDPAVGSAHFLESAIELLTEIYAKILDNAKTMHSKYVFQIVASDENGSLKKINLLQINDTNQVRLYLKFFIIVSKNIYGVDINQSALKIAKARLFLTIAKHFNFKKRYIIRFPNVHFNIRQGNSLIGYLNLKKSQTKKQQFNLEMFLERDIKVDIKSVLNVVNELTQYLNEVSKILEIKGNFSDKIKTLNTLLLKQNINWNDFRKLLNIKEELIRILIVSLNSQYAIPLNSLLNEINGLFYKKLNEKFMKDFKLNEIKSLNPFHWLFEFPEVFLDKKGFDIIIGNPPYLSSKEILGSEKEILKEFYTTAKSQFDLFTIFLEQCHNLLHEKSFFGFIIPDSFLSRSSFEHIRKLIIQKTKIWFIDIITGVFQDPTVSNVILIYEKIKPEDNQLIMSKGMIFKEFIGNEKISIKVNQEFFNNTSNHSILFIETNIREILEKITNRSIKFGEIIEIHRGEELGKNSNKILEQTNENAKKLLFGEDVSRYDISFSEHYIDIIDIIKEKNSYFQPKILIRQLGENINAAFDDSGEYITIQTIYNIWVKDESFHPKYLLAVINSKLINFYYTILFKKELFPRILLENIKELPIIRISQSEQKKIIELVERLINCINLRNKIFKFWKKDSFLQENINISLKELILIDKANLQTYGMDEPWIEEIHFSPEEDNNLINKEFDNFRVYADDDRRIMIYGIFNFEEVLLLDFRTRNKKYLDIIYLELIKLLESKKKIKTMNDIYSKSEITITSPEKWQKHQSFINLVDKLDLDLKTDEEIFSKRGGSIAYVDNTIEYLENSIDSYIFKIFDLSTNQIKDLLEKINVNERVKIALLEKYRML